MSTSPSASNNDGRPLEALNITELPLSQSVYRVLQSKKIVTLGQLLERWRRGDLRGLSEVAEGRLEETLAPYLALMQDNHPRRDFLTQSLLRNDRAERWRRRAN